MASGKNVNQQFNNETSNNDFHESDTDDKSFNENVSNTSNGSVNTDILPTHEH